jgi:hypothetical protein
VSGIRPGGKRLSIHVRVHLQFRIFLADKLTLLCAFQPSNLRRCTQRLAQNVSSVAGGSTSKLLQELVVCPGADHIVVNSTRPDA